MNVCKFCTTEFKYKKQYNEHIVCCEFVHIRGKDRNTNVELVDDPIPSQRMMYELIKNLMFKNQHLEKEIDELRKYVKREKNKINVVEYLSGHHFPSMDYATTLKLMVVQPRNLETVLSGNIIDGVCSMFADIEVNLFPIAAFSHKQNAFYFYKDNIWQELPHESIHALFDILSNRFMGAYKRWEQSKPELNVESEEMQKQKMVFLKKVLGTSMSDDYKYRKFITWLFDKLKKNVRNIVEYEFD